MGRRLALLIGNAVYDDPAFPPLGKAGADVHAMAEVLGDQHIGGFEVTVLINETNETIRRAIAGLFQQGKKDDFLLLYFSGHGHAWNKLRYLYLIAKDTRYGLLSSTAISSTFIKEVMDLSDAETQVLILDCCCSGTFVQGMKGQLPLGEEIASVFAGSGRAILTASSGTEPAWEGDETLPLSLFTYYLVQGLATGEADSNRRGQITLDTWYDYTYRGVINKKPAQIPSKSIEKQQGLIVIAQNPVLTRSPDLAASPSHAAIPDQAKTRATPPLPKRVLAAVSSHGNTASQHVGSPPSYKEATRVPIKAALLPLTLIAALVGVLLMGIVLYRNTQLPSTSGVSIAATGTASAACEAVPILTGPVDGQTLNSRTVTLTWEPPQDCIPEGYTVRLSVNYDPEAKPWIVDTGWRPTYYPYTFSTDGTYYWHIRACKPCTPFHPGNWAIRSFTIHTSSTP